MIQDVTSTPSLQSLGIRIHSTDLGHQASAPTGVSQADTTIDQQERLTLAGLQLQNFESAYLVMPGGAQPIDTGRFSSEPLLQSLRQLGQRVDIDTALDLHQAASSLVASLRGQGALAQQEPVLLRLTGAFGEIELDLDRLQPEQLRHAFSSGLAEAGSGQMASTHGQLASLSQLIRAGFGGESAHRLDGWLDAVMAPDFEPAAFLSQAFGYNPLNQESSVRHLLQEVQASPGAEDEPLAELLREKIDALVEAANRLEDELELAPAPDSPDILDLLRAFQAILRQLDRDIAKLLKQQQQAKQFERRLLAHFAENLHRRLDFQQHQLDALHRSPAQRLRLLMQQSFTELESRVWLARQQGGHADLLKAQQMLAEARN